MATADKLLHDAQFAFASISYGESRANKRNRVRATSLCRKIIRKYPGSMEAAEALAILRRLGEESYHSELPMKHRHITEAQHHGKALARRSAPLAQSGSPVVESRPDARPIAAGATGRNQALDWDGLFGLLLAAPKVVFGVLVFVVVFLFPIFGPFLLFLPMALLLFTGPFRSMLNRSQRDQADEFIARVNAWIAERRRTGGA